MCLSANQGGFFSLAHSKRQGKSEFVGVFFRSVVILLLYFFFVLLPFFFFLEAR